MPEEQIRQFEERIMKLERIIEILVFSDRYQFQRDIQLQDGKNIVVSAINGTKIGTATTQKIGFLGATPIARQSAITAPSGGLTQDAEARTAINSIITILEDFGLVAPN